MSLKDNMSKMLLTLGIIHSMETYRGGEGLDILSKHFDYKLVEDRMEKLAEPFADVSHEKSVAIAIELLEDLYPEAVRQTVEQPA